MKKNLLSLLASLLLASLFFVSCCGNKNDCVQPAHPEWSKNATVYEVNLRQYTPEGTIAAFQDHLPRLKDLGVDILWFMPVHPIGEKERKGELGSYYSVRDYSAINPEFGTEAEFKALVKEAHKLGFKVILDLVANHTSRDHRWVAEQPQWYKLGTDGEPIAPFDWSDVAQLNWDNPDLRDAFLEEMKYAVKEWNIDGYRCDVAGMVPLDFWERARKELDAIKPVFMLAEDDDYKVFLNYAFDASYAWELSNDILNGLAQGKRTVNDVMRFYDREQKITPRRAYRLMFTSNHDENSWVGTEFERMGDAVKVLAVFTFTFPNSLPLIYSGQEVGFDKRLEFFVKDEILWTESEFTPFYQTLTAFKKNNAAVANGEFGGRMVRINTQAQDKVLAFVREVCGNKVFTVLNLSKAPLTVVLEGDQYAGEYTEIFTKNTQTLSANQEVSLPAWGYLVFTK